MTSSKPKVNPLKPTMREKKRYVSYQIASAKPLAGDADRKLIARMEELLGVFQAAQAGIMRVKYDAKTQTGLFRVDRRFLDYARACFVMVRTIDAIPVRVATLRVSGMLNKAHS